MGASDAANVTASDGEAHRHHRESEFQHKDLWPLSSQDVFGLGLSIAGLMIAAGGGIGGGGILVPLYILVLQFHPKYAIPLSNITIFGGAITNTYLNAPKRHPLADRPLVDWDLILVMEPLTIGGALVGSFVNKVLPEWLLTIMLVVLLVATAHRTMKKGWKLYAKETAASQGIGGKGAMAAVREGLARQQEQREARPLLAGDEDDEDDDEDDEAAEEAKERGPPGSASAGVDEEEGEGLAAAAAGDFGDADVEEDHVDMDAVDGYTLRDVLMEEATTPWDKVQKLAGVFAVILVLNLAKGGGGFSPLGVACGSFFFWFLTALMLAILGVVSTAVRKHLVDRTEMKSKLLYKYMEGDVVWDAHATIVYPAVCALAGFAAGMFGVGGGIVKGPLMLEMGVHPQVASATSACMILYTSFTATTSFIVFGMVKYDYAIFLFLVGVGATAVGQLAMNHLIRQSGRQSLIVLSIGSVVTLSALLLGGSSVYHLAYGDMESGDTDICDAGE